MGCIFCEIAQRPEEEMVRIIEFKHDFYAMYVLTPESYGHFIVVPIKHFAELNDMKNDYFSQYTLEIKWLASRITDDLGADAYVLKINNKVFLLNESDKNHVGHIHCHVIPCYKEDRISNTETTGLRYFNSLPKLC